jgi:hypothetical protein
MPQINQLPTRTPVAGDLVPFFSSNNGDAAKTSFTAIATLMTQLMGVSGGGGFITQYSQPTATAFTVTVGGIGQSAWLIITPTTAGFSGTITFPDVSTVADQQELIISTTNDVLLTYVATGMTVFGAPAALAAGSSAVFKYNLVSKFWYCVSGFEPAATRSFGCYDSTSNNQVIATPLTYIKPVWFPTGGIQTGSDFTIEYDGSGDDQPYLVYGGTESISALVSFSFTASNNTSGASIMACIGDDSTTLSASYAAEEYPYTLNKNVNMTVSAVISLTETDNTVRLWLSSSAASTIALNKLQMSIVELG